MIRFAIIALLFSLSAWAEDTVPVQEDKKAVVKLQRLFFSAEERQQIDQVRELRKRGITEEAVDLSIPPDIFFQAVLYRAKDEPLLWINNYRATLSRWQQNTVLLAIDKMRLSDDVLSVRIDDDWYQLKPNQLLMRQTGEVVEPNEYIPPAQVTATGAVSEAVSTAPGTLIKKVKQINQQTKLPDSGSER